MSRTATIEQDPLAMLIEESGLENSAENRQEAEKVKAMFTAAHEKDVNLSPEGREQIEGEISLKQDTIVQRATAVAAKAQKLDIMAEQRKRGELLEDFNRAESKTKLYEKLALTSYAGIVGGLMAPIGLAMFEQMTGINVLSTIPDVAVFTMLTTGLASLLGSVPFSTKAAEWKNNLFVAKSNAKAAGVQSGDVYR